ncbi:MAG: SpoIID/LytB domain-containing protein [Eubacteriales bacterium]|nr:SpoIID/LytB domain-containing protein [Eubacteriales bacterium]
MEKKIERTLALILLFLALPCALIMLLGGRMEKVYRTIQDEAAYISVQTGQGIRDMNLEEYVIGVTAAEMPQSYEPEAVKAQMVLTRTNLYRSKEEGKVWQGAYVPLTELEAAGVADKFLKAQEATKQQILTYEGEPVMASFHALSAGNTRSGEETFQNEGYPYLKSKACPSDKRADDYECRVQIADDWRGLTVVKKDSAGYVQQVQIGDAIYSGEEFRNLLGLPSAHFQVDERKEGIFLNIQGIGHGIGMSQNTAQEMALSGKKYKEILGYFFEGTGLHKLSVSELADIK